jgi:pimeloyl-ACP methyl ester carboxylesterase
VTVREVPVTVPGSPPLAGTLALPRLPGPAPAVLLAPGSGPLDRDSDHRRARFGVTRALAHALADAGLASLRYDKRGVGGTPGDWRRAGLHDLADDLARARDVLAARHEVDGDRVVLAGHSEGALLAAAVAARGVPVAGVVLLAASARPGGDLLRWQARQLGPTLPAPVRGLLRLLRTDLERKVAANHQRILATTTDVARIGGVRLNARWHREFLVHDPRRDLAALEVPVLAVTGSKDLQVPPDDLEVVAATVRGPVETLLVPDLTHTLRRRAGPASVRGYRSELRRPVDPDVLSAVVGWCRRVCAVPFPS